MKLYKRLLLSALLTIGLTISSPSAHAAYSLFTVVSPVLGVLLGAPSLLVIFRAKNGGAFAIGTLGLILDRKTNEFEFRPLSDSQAESLALSSMEKEAYNGELDRINASFEEMNSAITNGSDAKLALENFKADISGDAFSSVQKIVKSIAKNN